ncbi:MAG: ABC transporter ATP-binding protein [Lachnospiraceae bacterium]|nr:ABC transporter ATP-binding protein [uncultured Oribacterium sp.]MBF0982868.1 ABC transporter ATP-binding protein [Lachnospiraceae bacterium]
MALVLENVSKSFSRKEKEVTFALSPVNLTVEEGEFISIVGPSGCGKSTLLRLVAGLLTPTSGKLSLDGEEIMGTDAKRGMAFQKPTLFPWLTVEENIAFGPKVRKENKKEEIERMLALTHLSDFRSAYPHELSGGMAQRVALVRTMINEPEVFLLDEPLGALDAFTRMKMQDELLLLWKEKKNMMLMVTHDVDEAIYMGTRVLVMAKAGGSVLRDIPIDLAYKRKRLDPKFLSYREEIMRLLGVDAEE